MSTGTYSAGYPIGLVPTMQRLADLVQFETAVHRLENAKDPVERRAFALELDALVKR